MMEKKFQNYALNIPLTKVAVQRCHSYFKTQFPDFHWYFSWNATHFPLILHDILIISFDRCGVWESLDPTFCSSKFWFIKRETVLQVDCTEQNAIRRGKLGNCHAQLDVWVSIETVTSLKWNNSNSTTSLIFPDFSKYLSFSPDFPWIPWFPWFGGNSVTKL